MLVEPKVLILDDDPIITDLLAEVLQQEGFKVMASNSPKDVLFLAKQFLPDALLLDLMMPEIDGYDVCDFFRRDQELKFTRIVILTARDSLESRVKCYKAGADVVLSKPFEMDELREVIHSQVRSKMSTQQVFYDLQTQAVLDRTAQCYSRKYLERRLGQELKRVDRYKHPMALLLLDIDNFKVINARYGFGFGDEVLKDVARALREDLRASDLVGRYAEDSLLIVLPETPKPGAKSVVTRLHDAITSLVFLKRKKLALKATIATVMVEEPQKLEDVFATLEEKLRHAQELRSGRQS
jgi:diguanylate cyclase (GGDEF)-like protein